MALYVVDLVDLGSSPSQVKPKTITLVFIASLRLYKLTDGENALFLTNTLSWNLIVLAH
jgi:hypothetical protein